MFTLKLYKNGSPTPEQRTVIIETVGLWIDQTPDGVKRIRAFGKSVGTEDELGTPIFYVGGNPALPNDSLVHADNVPAPINTWDNYYDWGVLENAQGKTTEMLR